ncbi:MAG: response regulator transcription factor [Bacteroidetes bacterium]|nr:response regulator transcription factor [Bacteroidota bacterium]
MDILLCTAEELMLTTLEFRFRKNSWKLTIAENSKMALDKAQKFSPDLVVVDLNLPEFAGLDIVQSLRREFGPDLPILALGPVENDKLLLDSLRLGANDFIVSPYKPDELILRIRRQLLRQKVAGSVQ